MTEHDEDLLPTTGQILEQLTTSTCPVLVAGAPGTGKTTLLIDFAVNRLDAGLDPLSLLIIAPTRTTAARLRNDLSARAQRTFTEPVVRTWSAYAFDLIRRARVAGLLPYMERAPRLLSGPEQDTLIGQLLQGHEEKITPGPRWPEELELAIGTRGFRKEVREFFDRVSELGLEPAGIAELGNQAGRQEWVAAAQFYQEYRDLLDLGSAEAFDPAGLITRAAELLEANPQFLALEQDQLKLVLVDDLQEANLSQHRLLALLRRDRAMVAFAGPDNVVQGFRGARADQLANFSQRYSNNGQVQELELQTSFRMGPELAEAWTRVVRRVPVAAGTRGRKLSGFTENVDSSVHTHYFENATQEERFIAQQIVELNLYEQRSLDEIAIVVRNGSQVRSISRFLEGQGIAVVTPPAEIPLKEESAVRPLLDLLSLAVGVAPPDDPLRMQSLLLSRFGMSTSLEIRRLRQLLRQRESANGGNRSSQELLEATLHEPELARGLGPVGRGLERILEMHQRLVEELHTGHSTPETALWAMWEASGRSEVWRKEALAGGGPGRRADHDLDAVLSLFQAAERFVDQLPGASVSQFVEHILEQDLPMDSLASRSATKETVTVLTTAAAAGMQWPVVFIPGVQEGSWPNLRLRGELLGSNALADVVEHGTQFLATRTPAHLVREIRNDELRSFSNAISRASGKLICTAVDNEEQQHSSFLEILDPDRAGGNALTEVPRIRSLPTLVAELRAEGESALAEAVPKAAGVDREQAHAVASDAGSVLHQLATAEPPVRGAHPNSWWGLLPLSSTGPVFPAGLPIKVSPSKVEAVKASPLNWFVQAAGGLTAQDFAASLGTLIHSIAEEHPDASGGEYAKILEQRWPEMEMPQNWEGQRDYDRAEQMLRKLALYSLQMRAEGRSLVARELPFEVQLPNGQNTIHLRGVIDRIEMDERGKPYVVDLKTGARMPSTKDALIHPQLGVYQAAVKLGALTGNTATKDLPTEPAGAALVFVGAGTKKPSLRTQAPLADELWAENLIIEAAALMGEAEFITRHDASRGSAFSSGCSLPEICPLCSEGRQVTEP